jgi:hypothetical protein
MLPILAEPAISNQRQLLVSLRSILLVMSVYASLFSEYHQIPMLGYFFAAGTILLSLNRLFFTQTQVISLVSLLIYLLLALLYADSPEVVLKNFRFWYGVVIFIFLFKVTKNINLLTSGLFRLVCLLVIAEAILVNTLVDPASFYTTSDSEIGVLMGWYQRPLSFAGNASMSSVALVVLYFLIERLNRKSFSKADLLLLLITVIVFCSGAGFGIFLVMLLFRRFFDFRSVSRSGRIRNALTLTLSFIGAYILATNIDSEYFPKFSLEYVKFIFTYKASQVSNIFFSDFTAMILGSQIHDYLPITSGDFGWFLFFYTNGVLGTLVFIFLLSSFYAGGIRMLPVLLLLLLGSLHYPAAMTYAGQLLLAFILVTRPAKFRADKLNASPPVPPTC